LVLADTIIRSGIVVTHGIRSSTFTRP
jgi:hypothetical protein